MGSKTMRQFIREKREVLDIAIRTRMKDQDYRLNDKERENWIRNDEALYNWAREEGVRV